MEPTKRKRKPLYVNRSPAKLTLVKGRSVPVKLTKYTVSCVLHLPASFPVEAETEEAAKEKARQAAPNILKAMLADRNRATDLVSRQGITVELTGIAQLGGVDAPTPA